MKSQSAPTALPDEDIPVLSYQKIFNGIIDVVCVVDESGIFQFVSPSSVHLFGYEASEMTGRSIFGFMHPEDRERTVTSVDEKIDGHITSNFQNRYIRKDGSVVPVIWSRRKCAEEGLYYCVARDGSEKVEVDQRLMKAQQMARVANYEFDLQTQSYTYASETLFDIFGLNRSEHPRFTSTLFWSLVHPEDHQLVKEDLLLRSGRHGSTLEFRIIRPDGRIAHLNRLREVITDEGGRPVKTVGTLQDISQRKLDEMAVQQSEERLRSLVQNSNDIIGIIDANGIYRFVSQSAIEIQGREAKDLTGTSFFLHMHEDDAPVLEDALANIASGQSLTVGPYRYKNSCGEWQWMETVVSNQLHNPAINGYIITSRDVTQKKQEEEEQLKYEQRIQRQHQMMMDVLEQMQDGFLAMKLDGKIIYWNKQAEIITGRRRIDMLGENFWDLFPGMEKTVYFDIFQELLQTSKPLQKEVLSPFSNKWLDLHAYRTPTSITVFFRDITSQRKAEEELQKLSLIARRTNNPVIIQDGNRKVQWVNDAFTRLSGFRLDECVGKHITAICDGPETDAKTLRFVQEKVNRKESFRIETLNYKKNGDIYWSDVTCQPIFNAAGELVQFFSIATDITERKRLQQQLEREQKERSAKIAAATLKAQEAERAVVSQELHDNVNQVLTTVKLYTEMCRDGMGDTAELMEKSIELLQRSINEIRGLSKRLSAPSLGKIKLSDSIKELIATVDMTGKLQVQLDTIGIEALEVPQDVHLAVYRILQEQLTNILKHAEATVVNVSVDVLVGHLNLQVQDNGKGFDPLLKSSGIGITNMVTRAESLGGALRLNSSPGKGCEVLVTIPLSL